MRRVNKTHILCGYGKRTSLSFVNWLREVSSIDVTAVRLVDSRAFHLDLCLCVFNETSAIIARDAFSPLSLKTLTSMFPDHLFVDMEDRYACNGLLLHSVYIVSHAPPFVRKWLRMRGVDTVFVNCRAFHKEDGGVHCLTNEL